MRNFGFILFAAALAATPLAAQETAQEREDRGYLAGLLEDNLSGAGRQVIIDGFQGALSSRATIDRLTIADDQGVWLTLNKVTLDWNRAALLRGRVSVNELSADEIIVARLPQAEAGTTAPSPEAKPFSLPDLPVSVQIGKLSAPRIELGETILGEPLEGRLEAQASLAGGEGQVSLILERTDSGPSGKLQLSGSYANASRQLILDLSLAEGSGGIASRLIGLPGTPAVELSVKGQGAIEDFTARINLTSDGQPRLAGAVSLKGAQDGSQGFAVDLGGDIAPLFLPEYAAFFGTDVKLVASGARTAAGVTELQALDLRTQALAVQGSAAIASDGMPEKLDLTMQMGMPDGSPVLLPTSGADRIYLDKADLSLAFDSADDAGWRARGHLLGLKQTSFGADRIEFAGSGRILRAPTGNVVGGTLRYGVHELAMTDPALAQAAGRWLNGHVLFQWQQGGTGLRLPDIAIRGDGYRATGGVTLAGLDSAMQLTVRAEADVDNLAQFSAVAGRPLAGAGHVTLNGTGSPLTGAFDGRVQVQGTDLAAGIAQVDNLLKGTSTVVIDARRDETGTVLRNLDVQAQTLHLTGSGTVATAGSDIGADLDFRDLSSLGPQYRGALTGRLHVQGTAQNATLTLDGTGSDLAIGVQQADALLRGQSLLGVAVVKTGDDIRIDRASVANPQLSAQAGGTITGPARVMDLTANAAIPNLSVIGGGYRGAIQASAKVSGTVQDGRITADATGTNLAVGQTHADRLLAGNSRISADLALQGGAIRINKATLDNPQLTADATGSINGDTRTVNLNARLANLAILQPEFPGPVTLTGTAVDSPQGVRLDIAAKGPGQIDGRMAGTFAPGYGSADLTIRGTGQAALINAFLDPRAISGAIAYDLRLNGPMRLSSLAGRVSLSNARVVDPSLAFAIQGLNATANLSGGRAQVQANAEVSTGGHLSASGTVGLEAPFNADLNTNASWVMLRDPSLYETRLNGQIAVRGPLTGGANITGRIDLVETELRIPSTGFGGIGALPDLRHFNDPKPVRDTRRRAGADATAAAGRASSTRPFGLDVLISAPNRLFIRGRGLDAELGGELRVTGTTANVVPVGGFELIRGRLDILGKRLDLSEATVRMEGDMVPDLAIAATSESDGIAASVRIDGRADDPQVSFTSTPELPQEEVLARLLFGKGLENISALQAAQLASAVMTLAGRGGEGIVGKLRSGFGLDNFDVQTDATGGASVTAGKYLSKNLYTEVGVDSQGETEIHLNLDVSKSVTVRARTGSDGDSGLGVYYEHDY
ncbi:MAG: translocation/assembly module TamB domain-containing protein [Paracoccaceae bacterium]